MLTRDQDFEVYGQDSGVIRCRAKTPETASAFKALQIQLQRLIPQLPEPPPIEITVDGEIGPSVTLLVQMILTRLAASGHDQLAPLATAQPEEAIPATAALVMEIAGYIESVLAKEPTALLAPRPKQLTGPDPIEMLKGIFTIKRVVATVGVIAGITGLALAAHASDRRARGVVDRSHLLPPSDGSDAFGDDGEDDEGGDAEDDDDGGDEHESEPTIVPSSLQLPPGPIIDIAA